MSTWREKRKILKVGEASYAITLPKKWCRELGVDLGDFVELEKHDNSIILRPSRKDDNTSKYSLRIALDATRRNTKQLVEEIIGAYIEGVKEIHIRGNPEVLEEALRILKKKIPGLVVLPGVKEGSLKLVFMDVLVSTESIINKLSDLLDKVINMTIDTINNNKLLENKEYLNEIKDEIESMYYLGLRISKNLIRQGSEEKSQVALDTIMVLRDINDIGNSLVRIIESLPIILYKGIESDITSSFVRILDYISELYKASISSYLENSINKSLVVLGKEEIIIEYVDEITAKIKNELPTIKDEILLIIKNIMDITRITVSRCIRDKACRCRFFPILESK